MDFSDITQPKPYWQVLDEYNKAQQDPALAGTSMGEWSSLANQVSGSHDYDEGLNDSWMRRLGAAPSRVLHHFGGQVPGSPILSAISGASLAGPLGPVAPTLGEFQGATGTSLSEMLGGPKEGWDLPELAHKGAASLAGKLGASPGISEAVGKGAGGLVETLPAAGAGIVGGIPAMAAMAGLETYGQTGKLLPSATSAGITALIPGFMKFGGQTALKAVGAKTLQELSPELENLMAKGAAPTAEKLAERYPVGFGQRALEFGGKQLGLTANMLTGGSAQIAEDPNMTWSQKLSAMGDQFSPSSLVTTAIGQLPFTAMDLAAARVHPLDIAKSEVRGDFAKRFTAKAEEGIPAEGTPGEPGYQPPIAGYTPSSAEVGNVIDRLEKGETIPQEEVQGTAAAAAPATTEPAAAEPAKAPELPFVVPKTVNQVLASMGMGNAPVDLNMHIPMVAQDGTVEMPKAVPEVTDRANATLVAQGLAMGPQLGPNHVQMVYQAIRATEEYFKHGLTMDDTMQVAAQRVADAWAKDKRDLSTSGYFPPGEAEPPPYGTEKNFEAQQEVNREIALRTSRWLGEDGLPYDENRIGGSESRRANPMFDEKLAQLMAIISGDREHWLQAGIPEDLMTQIYETINRETPRVLPENREEGVRELTIKTREQPIEKKLAGNIIDKVSRLGPKTSERIQALERAILDEMDRNGIFIPDPNEPGGMKPNPILEEYGKRIDELDRLGKRTRGGLQTYSKSGAEKTVGGPLGDATFAARRYALKNLDKYDITNPESLAKFIKNITGVIRQAEQGWARIRGPEPFLKDKDGNVISFSSKAAAETEAGRQNGLPQSDQDFKIEYKVPDKPEKDGTWRVIAHHFFSTFGLPITEDAGLVEPVREVGEGSEEARLAGAPEGTGIPEDSTEKAQIQPLHEASGVEGATMADFKDEMLSKRFIKFGDLSDPAEAEARKGILARNSIDFINGINDATFLEMLKNATGQKFSKPADLARLRQKFIGYIMFLRQGGRVNIQETGETKHQITSDGTVISVPKGRLEATEDSDLKSFNRAMGTLGYGQYKKGSRAGEEQTHFWNQRDGRGFNFWEKFAIFSKEMQKAFIDPRTFKVDPERRPLGDHGWLSPEYRRDLYQKINLDGWTGLEKAQGAWLRTTKKEGEAPDLLFDENGQIYKFKIEKNPIETMQMRSAQHDLFTTFGKVVDLYKRFGNVDPNKIAMAEALLTRLPYVRNMRVGYSMTIDPFNRGYMHTDTVGSSAGVLVDPFVGAEGFKMRLQTPAESFDTHLEEMGHASVDFAWNTNPEFKAQVQEIFDHVKGHAEAGGSALNDQTQFYKDLLATSLRDPREMLAAMFKDENLHRFLKSIPDLEKPPVQGQERAGYVGKLIGSVYDRLKAIIKNLFGSQFGPEHATPLFDRMSDLVTRMVEHQAGMQLTHDPRSIYKILYERGNIAGDLISEPPPQPIPKPVTPTPVYRQFETRPVDFAEGTGYGPTEPPAEHVQRRALWRNVMKAGFRLRQAQAGTGDFMRWAEIYRIMKENLDAYDASGAVEPPVDIGPRPEKVYPKTTVPSAIDEAHLNMIKHAEDNLQMLKEMQSDAQKKTGGFLVPFGQFITNETIQNAEDFVKYVKQQATNPYPVPSNLQGISRNLEFAIGQNNAMIQRYQRYGDRFADKIAQHQSRGKLMQQSLDQIREIQRTRGSQLQAETKPVGRRAQELIRRGQVLESRVLQGDDGTEIDDPIMHVLGRKGTALKDAYVNRALSRFANGHDIIDAFPGSGQTAQFAKSAGARNVTLNVLDPRMFQVFSEIKRDPVGFGKKVRDATAPITSPREQVPRMKDGSDLRQYLDSVEQRDPVLGLYVKQLFSKMGREVATTKGFTPARNFADSGIADMPNRLGRFSRQIDQVGNDNGWNVVRNAQEGGPRVVADFPYAGEGQYGAGSGTPVEKRLAEYEEHLYPAARRGGKFFIFDQGEPELMQSLADNGFTVLPIQRTSRAGAQVRKELMAFNHGGQELLESRVRPERVIDAMQSASVAMTEDMKGNLWFRPTSFPYFSRVFSGLGEKLQLAENKGVLGYRINADALRNLTPQDVANMPPPRVKNWAPSLYENLMSGYTAKGASPETASALANFNLQFGGLLNGSENVIYGHQDKPEAAGTAYSDRLIGLSYHVFTPDYKWLGQQTIRHETAHIAGIQSPKTLDYWRKYQGSWSTPDVTRANFVVQNEFNAMNPEERAAFIEGLNKLTDEDVVSNVAVYAAQSPGEFGAEFMGRFGDVLGSVPNKSLYLENVMRFAPDSISNLVKIQTLRRTQAFDQMAESVVRWMRSRGFKYPMTYTRILERMAGAFKELSRPALDIAEDVSEFQRSRLVYPDAYRGLLSAMNERMISESADLAERYKRGGQDIVTPVFKSQLLESRMGSLEGFLRDYFKWPKPDGTLPTKPGIWDRNLMQFPQFAMKYPTARSFYDMLEQAVSMRRMFTQKAKVALAGTLTGGQVLDDVRTKQINNFYQSPVMRNKLSKIALELNVVGDNRYDQAIAAANGDVFRADPQTVTGWMTPEYMREIMDAHGVTDAERPTIQLVLDGLRAQYNTARQAIVSYHDNKIVNLLARAAATNLEILPESARKIAENMMQAVRLESTDPQQGMQLLQQAHAQIPDADLFGRMLDMASSGWQDVRKLDRFLEIRLPYYFSEMRPGKFGVIWQDPTTKMSRSQYFADAKARNDYVTRNQIKPTRTINPGDRNFGIGQGTLDLIDQIHKRLVEKAANVFGEDDAKQMGRLSDFSTELREMLNRGDIIKATLPRALAPGREELDMFETSQHYLNALSHALMNRYVRDESALLFTSPEFNNEPFLKEHIQGHVNTVLQPDSPVGSFLGKLAFLHYLWGNLSSMVMQTSHQVMGLAPMLTRLGSSVAGSFGTIRKANQMVIDARIKNRGYKDPQIQELVDRLKAEVGLQSWISRDLDYNTDLSIVNRVRATDGKSIWTPFDLAKNRLYQGFHLLRRMYDIVPTYNSEVAFVASLLHLRSAKGGGLTGEELYRQAKFLRANTMYLGGKETRPGFFQWMPRSAAQAVWNLQTYANGLTTEMGELIRRSLFPPEGMSPAQTKQVRKAAVQMLMTQVGVAGMLGLPFASLAIQALQKLYPNENIEENIREALMGLGGDDEAMGHFLSNSIMNGIPSSTDYAPDLGSRFALHGVFHVSPYGDSGLETIVGPTGSIMRNVLTASQAGLAGEPIKAVQELLPVGMQRIWKSLEQGQNYVTGSGRIVVNDLRPEEVVARMIGFRPARVSRIQDQERLIKVTEDAEKATQTNWTKVQIGLMQQARDAEVRQNIAKRVQETRGLYTSQQLTNDIARAYESATTPVDTRKYGNRATVLQQRALRGRLGGGVSDSMTNMERMRIQANIARRLGFGGPSSGQMRRAAGVDQLLKTYPHLTSAQAHLLLTHAAGRATPDLRQELLTGNE